MRYFVTIDGTTHDVVLSPEETTVDGEPVEADLQRVAGTDVRSLLLDGRSHRLVARRRGRGEWGFHVAGRTLLAEVVDERTRAIREMTGAAAATAGPRPLKAPMPGLVVKVEVAAGDVVAPGQGLVIVEAMKMENELRAETAARVRTVHVAAGEPVEKGQVLMDFEEDEP